MNYKKGFLKLVIALSILTFLSVSIVTYLEISYNADIFWKNVEDTANKRLKGLKEIFSNLSKLTETGKAQLIEKDEGKKNKIIAEFCGLSKIEQQKVIDLLSFVCDNYDSLSLSQEEENTNGIFGIILRSMMFGMFSIIPIWIIYGLVWFVKTGFKKSEVKKER